MGPTRPHLTLAHSTERPAPMMTGMTFEPVAIIDIGSNSVRLVAYDGLQRASTPLYNEKVLCGLGRSVFSTGRLNEDSVQRALTALRRFRVLCDTMRVSRIFVLATAAARDAANGPAFLEAAREATQIRGARVDLAAKALVPPLELARHGALLLAVPEDLPREEVHDVSEPDREDERVRVEAERRGRLGRGPRLGAPQVPRRDVGGADRERPGHARCERDEHRARAERREDGGPEEGIVRQRARVERATDRVRHERETAPRRHVTTHGRKEQAEQRDERHRRVRRAQGREARALGVVAEQRVIERPREHQEDPAVHERGDRRVEHEPRPGPSLERRAVASTLRRVRATRQRESNVAMERAQHEPSVPRATRAQAHTACKS